MEKTVKILFFLLLIIFPLGQIGRIELGQGVALILNDIAVFAVVSVWLVYKFLFRKPFKKRPLTIPIFIFTAVALSSLAVNFGKFSLSEIGISSLYLVRWLAYAGLYFTVADFSDKFRKKIPFWLIGAGSVLAFFGFIQYFFYPNLRNLYYLGWDEHLYRLFSTFLDPNFAGSIFVATFLLAMPLALFKRNFLLILATIASFIALLLTYSRGSYLSFVVGVVILLWLMQKKKLVSLILIIFIAGIILLPKDFQSEGVKLLRTASIDARFEETQKAIAIFKDNALFGIGFNTYRVAQEQYGFPESKELFDRGRAGTDNSFLFVLATTGIVGFLAYLNLGIRVVREIRGSTVVIAILFAVCVHAFFVNSLFYPWTMEWLWILIGLRENK